MKLYPLAPGQINAVAGAEGPADLNGHVLPIAITSPERLDPARFRAAPTTMQLVHPSLRLRLAAPWPVTHAQQSITEDSPLLILEREADDDRTMEAMGHASLTWLAHST